MNNAAKFSANVYLIQLGLGLSDAQFADRLGISVPSLLRWKKGSAPHTAIQQSIYRQYAHIFSERDGKTLK